MAVLGGTVYYLLSTGIHSPQMLKGLRGQLGQFSFIFAAAVGAAMVSMGLYSRSAMSDYRTLAVKVLIALALVVPANIAGTSLFHDQLYESANANTYWWLKAPLVWLSVILLTRVLFSFADRREFMKHRIFVLGAGTRAAAVRQMAFHGSNETFVVAGVRSGCAGLRGSRRCLPHGGQGETQTDETDWLDVVRRASGRSSSPWTTLQPLPVSQLLRCRVEGIQVIDYQTFCERETGGFDLDVRKAELADLRAGLCLRPGHRPDQENLRRRGVVDLSAVHPPFTLIACIAIKLEAPSPILYQQERVGLHGKSFMVMKLRSMRQDAETGGSPQWAQVRDPRVTRVGAFIRLTRIDELPQLVNVLRGDMSFVGPRPDARSLSSS